MKNTFSKIYILVLFYSISNLNLLAQENFKSGYIITNSNDTVKGFISIANVYPYTNCSFRINSNDKYEDYHAGEIKAYRFETDGKYYISKVTPTPSGDKVFFLEYLIKGKANIYFMRDNVDHYYIETDTNKIIELSEPPHLIEQKDGLTFLKPASYFGKLKFMLSNCTDIYPEIDKLKLEPESLIKLAKDYHNRVCNNEQCIIFESKLKQSKIHLGIVAGASFNSFSFGNVHTNYGIGSILGCRLEFENLFYNSEQSTLQTGLILNRFSTYTFYTNNYGIVYNGNFITAEKVDGVDINTYALKIPFTYQYFLSLGKIRPFFGAGLECIILFSQGKNFDFTFFKRYATDNSFPVWNTGIVGNIGVKKMLENNHSISMELKYEYTGSLIANPLFGMRNSILSLVAGYSF